MYDVSVVVEITLQQQEVIFAMQIENQTPYVIGEVYFPILGGTIGLGNTRRELLATQLRRPTRSGVADSDIFVHFTNMSPFGDQGAEQFYRYPQDLLEPWMELSNPTLNRSALLQSDDPDDRPRVIHLEMWPGVAATVRQDGNWPRAAELQGLPSGVQISWVHFADHPPGRAYRAVPVALRFQEGKL